MNRIEAADPDALTALALILVFTGLMLAVAGVCHLMTKRRWPRGHEHDSFWGGARRINDE